ncbi:MAG: SPOR domain-containing protein [Adhaeribacter sp.]
MIQEHIHKLLFEHDCVIIPDFGGLITHYEPARIHPVRHAFLPPSKRVAFNEKLKLNDGLLISTFAYDTRISAEEAARQVGDFVRQIQQELHTSQRFELRGVGFFRLNAEQKIEFDYIASQNFLSDSFGLPEVITRPVLPADAAAGLRTLLKQQQEEQAVATAKPTLRRRLRKIYDTAALVAIAGLSCSALYFISLQTDYNLSSLNPLAYFGESANTARQTNLEPIEEPVLEEVQLASIPASPAPDLAEPQPAAPVPAAVTAASSAAPVAAKAAEKEAEKEIERVKEEKKVRPVLAAKALEAPAPVVKTNLSKKAGSATINSATNRYYIIAGGFSTLKSAKWGLKLLSKQGGKGKVILPASNGELHRVSVSDYASKEEALQQLPELKKKFGNNIWILNY